MAQGLFSRVALLLAVAAPGGMALQAAIRPRALAPALFRSTSASRSFGKKVQSRRRAIMDMSAAGSDVRVRFAPSPTGTLHVGGARTALFNWLKARKEGGKFILRIEDTDLARSTRESEESMIADLRWLGLDWDEGPDVGGDFGPYRQSERSHIYKECADKLIAEGHAYPCFASEEELEAQRAEAEAKGENFVYPGTWRDADPKTVEEKIKNGDPYVVRFKVPPGARVEINDLVRGQVGWDAEAMVGDFILLRSSGVPVYNFCVAVDDATMGITHVVRAEEHLSNTLRQGLVLEALGYRMPTYAHASLILGEDRSKLSKRHGATSVDQFKREGFCREAMINYLAGLGWNDGTDKEIYSVPEVISAFSIDRIVNSPSMFDMQKLKWVNSQHVRAYTPEALGALLAPLLASASGLFEDGEFGPHPLQPSDKFVNLVVSASQDKIETLQDAVSLAKTVLSYPFLATVESGAADEILNEGDFKELTSALVAAYDAGSLPGTHEDPAAFSEEQWKGFVKGLGKELGRKGKRLFHPVRLAVTGTMSGPDVGLQASLVSEASTMKGLVTGAVVPLSERMELLRSWTEAKGNCPEQPVQGAGSGSGKGGKKKKKKLLARDVLTSAGLELLGANPRELNRILDDFRAGREKAPKGEKEATKSGGGAKGGEAAAGGPILEGLAAEAVQMDIRVGTIVKAWPHPDSDKLWCEEIDLGEPEPRTICSGLRAYYSEASELEGRSVCVLANLKPRKMAGVSSDGMVMCASSEADGVVKFLEPPAGAVPGDRVSFEGLGAAPEPAGRAKGSKIAEKVVFAGELSTSEDGACTFQGEAPMVVEGKGPVTAPVPSGYTIA